MEIYYGINTLINLLKIVFYITGIIAFIKYIRSK